MTRGASDNYQTPATRTAVGNGLERETPEDRMRAATRECRPGDAHRVAITRKREPPIGRVTRYALRRGLPVRDGTDGTAA